MNHNNFSNQIELKDYIDDNDKNIFYADNNIILFDNLSRYLNRVISLSPKSIVLLGCKRGTLKLTINQKPYELQQNKVLLIWPGSIINIDIESSDFIDINMCLSLAFIVNMLRHRNDLWIKFFHLKENPLITISEEYRPLFSMYERLISLRLKHFLQPYHKEIITILIKASLYELFANLPFETPKGTEFKRKNELFREFIELLLNTESKPRYLNYYADKLCISSKYLSCICKEVTGKNAKYWIDEYTIEHIKNLLMYTHKSIKEISEYLGFPNTSFFSKYVKRNLGYTPKEFRKI